MERAAGVAEFSGVIQVSVRARKWRVMRDAQAEMESAFLTADLAVPESSHHFKVSVGKGRWMAQIGWVAAPSRGSMVASSMSGSPDDE